MTSSGRGRPRSERARESVLAATRDLLLDPGYDAMTMEGIAARAGVGKQTIYRWWGSKAALVADATVEQAVPAFTAARTPGQPLREDLRAWLREIVAMIDAPQGAAHVRALAAAVATDPDAAETLYRQVTGPSVDAVVDRLRRAQADGEVRAGVDLQAASDAFAGFVLFLVLTSGDVTVERLDGLLEVVLNGVSRRPDAP